jgi:hypothetical protein
MKILSTKQKSAVIIETDEEDDIIGDGDNKKYLRLSRNEWYEKMGTSLEMVFEPESEELEAMYSPFMAFFVSLWNSLLKKILYQHIK